MTDTCSWWRDRSKQQWRSKHSSATDELQTAGAATIALGVKRRGRLWPTAAEKGRTSSAIHKEESMATQSFLDLIQEFGTGLGVPKVDVDKLIEVHRRNIDALGRSAQVATEGAKSLADKQHEIIETAFRGEVRRRAITTSSQWRITWRPCRLLVCARRNILRRPSTPISTRLLTCLIRRSGWLSSAYAISWRPKSHRSSRTIGPGTSCRTRSSPSCARSTSISKGSGTGTTAPPAVAGCSTASSLWRWRASTPPSLPSGGFTLASRRARSTCAATRRRSSAGCHR